jgi:hypothetical protein
MLPFRKFGLLFLVLAVMLCIAAPLFMVAAQEATPDPVLVTDANATQVVIIPPPSTPAPVETALPSDNPRGGLSDGAIWDGFVKPAFVLLMLLVIALFGSTIYLAIQHIPAWARPFLPMVKAGVGAIAESGFATLKESAKLTPEVWDDELYATGQKQFEQWLAGLDSKLDAKLDTAMRQATASMSGAFSSAAEGRFQDSPSNIG